MSEQVARYIGLLKPGGPIVLEDPDVAPWRYKPDAPAGAELIDLIVRAVDVTGGDFSAGWRVYGLLAKHGAPPASSVRYRGPAAGSSLPALAASIRSIAAAEAVRDR
jgi:hypothetical protein